MAAQRRANVGRYVNVDGQSQNPGVPTLAVWAGRGTPGRSMAGATNVTIPNQTHVQTCTSAQSFVEYYKFLTGRRPARDIVRQNGVDPGRREGAQLPGEHAERRARPFRSGGSTTTGSERAPRRLRHSRSPTARQAAAPGDPIAVQSGTRYEFALVRPALPTLHIYYEPFLRSDYTLRLLQSLAIEQYSGNRPGSMSAVNIRYKELWGDQGAESDQLLINGTNVCTPVLCPISKQVNAFFAFDRNRDGQTDLSYAGSRAWRAAVHPGRRRLHTRQLAAQTARSRSS